jgi:hypothetical protein
MARRVRSAPVDRPDLDLRWEALAKWASRVVVATDQPDPVHTRRKVEVAQLARELRADVVDPAGRVAQFEAALGDMPWPFSDSPIRTYLDSALWAIQGGGDR